MVCVCVRGPLSADIALFPGEPAVLLMCFGLTVWMWCAVQVTGAGTSSAPPPVREGSVPTVAKYAPRFKPQTSAGSRGSAPKEKMDVSKAIPAPATFQSMLHCFDIVALAVPHLRTCSSASLSLFAAGPQTATFKPSFHSTPEGMNICSSSSSR